MWGADLDLKTHIKTHLPPAEIKRLGKLYRKAESQQSLIASPELEQAPALIAPWEPPLIVPGLEQQTVPELIAPGLETAPTQEAEEPELAQITMPEPETITPEDAEKMRSIARIWWDQLYPDDLTKLEQWQSLISQMFAWKAPGAKYSRDAIKLWLESEDAVVRDRLDELWRMKHGEGLVESPDCGF